MESRHSFSTERLHLWALVTALLAAILAVLPGSSLSVVAAVFVVAVYILLDVIALNSRRCRGLLAISYFACGLAYAVAASVGMLILFPLPPRPTTDFADRLEAITEAVAVLFQYLLVFNLLTVVSFSIAVASGANSAKRSG